MNIRLFEYFRIEKYTPNDFYTIHNVLHQLADIWLGVSALAEQIEKQYFDQERLNVIHFIVEAPMSPFTESGPCITLEEKLSLLYGQVIRPNVRRSKKTNGEFTGYMQTHKLASFLKCRYKDICAIAQVHGFEPIYSSIAYYPALKKPNVAANNKLITTCLNMMSANEKLLSRII